MGESHDVIQDANRVVYAKSMAEDVTSELEDNHNVSLKEVLEPMKGFFDTMHDVLMNWIAAYKIDMSRFDEVEEAFADMFGSMVEIIDDKNDPLFGRYNDVELNEIQRAMFGYQLHIRGLLPPEKKGYLTTTMRKYPAVFIEGLLNFE